MLWSALTSICGGLARPLGRCETISLDPRYPMRMPHTMSVYPATVVREAWGNPLYSYPDPVYTSVACFLQPASAASKMFFFQANVEVSHTIYTPRTDLALNIADMIVIAGRQFSISGWRDMCELGRYLAIDVFEYKGQQRISL